MNNNSCMQTLNRREDMKKCDSKKGFTLAEVLITLGIIGVVAALTMPSIIANYQKKVISVRLKKFVSTFSQAYNMAISKYGDSTYWIDCSIKSGNANCTEYDGSATKKIIESLNAVDYSNNLPEMYKQKVQESKKNVGKGGLSWTKFKSWQLADGALLFNMVDWNDANSRYLTTFDVDVNGISGPNRYGKDIFIFAQVYTMLPYSSSMQYSGGFFYSNTDLKKGLYMSGYGYFKDEPINGVNGPIKRCNADSFSVSFKYYCSYLIQENGWEFPDYYPWGAF